jgi:hypothetical protein
MVPQITAPNQSEERIVAQIVARHFAARIDGFYLSTYRLCDHHPELRQLVKQAVRRIQNRVRLDEWIADVLRDDKIPILKR